MKKHFITLFEYDHWANRRFVETIDTNGITDEKVLSLLSHVLWAQSIWMKRIKKEEIEGYAPFVVMNLEDLKSQTEAMATAYLGLINELDDFSGVLLYSDSQGNPYSNELKDVLTHVNNHGTYHRGQIAARVKELGFQPPRTDYIVFFRK